MYKKLCTVPFALWILCGTIVPMATVFYYGFTQKNGNFTLSNFLAILEPEHFRALFLALILATVSTIICLIISVPLAMIVKRSSLGEKGFVIFIFILPMWMNFLLRTMAWQVMLERGGFFNRFLTYLNLPNIDIMNTFWAIILGMVYDFLPFMLLPIYNNLCKIDKNVIEAAYDLGASKIEVFYKIILPLIVPGIASGVTMVFVPALTTFVISNLLGGGKIYLIGNVIEQEFITTSNWNLGSGLSIVMMIFIIVSMSLLSKFDKNGEGNLI